MVQCVEKKLGDNERKLFEIIVQFKIGTYLFFEFFSTLDFHKIKEKKFQKTNCNSSPYVYIHPEYNFPD